MEASANQTVPQLLIRYLQGPVLQSPINTSGYTARLAMGS